MLDYALIGTQDIESPTLRLLYGDAFEVVPKAHHEPGLAVCSGLSAHFIQMRKGSPDIEKRIWSDVEPFTQPMGNLAYRGLVPFRTATLVSGETKLAPADEATILLAATWPGTNDDNAAFSLVGITSVLWGVVPLIIPSNEQQLWLDKTRDVRPMLTSSKERWVEGRPA